MRSSDVAALPEKRVPADLNRTPFRRKLAAVIKKVDKQLLNLAGFEVKRQRVGNQLDRDSNRFAVGKGRDLMQSLFHAIAYIAVLQVRPPPHVTANAQLEHGVGHA